MNRSCYGINKVLVVKPLVTLSKRSMQLFNHVILLKSETMDMREREKKKSTKH